jgi:2-polyprenyl-3-methyl-5-hydroxy-6-metoxy-1,4-benzoquinol methylase
MSQSAPVEYKYTHGDKTYEHDYLVRPALSILKEEMRQPHKAARIFDLGCGNAAIAAELCAAAFSVTGVDVSESGIASARRAHPNIDLHVGSAYDDLAARFGQFPFVMSFEVVEHLYNPRAFARTVYDLLEPGGLALISTPYHGYLKNLLIALLGRCDAHWAPLWDHGHIKFWSVPTITKLMTDAGFADLSVTRVGRIAPLAKSMIVRARKPRL